MDYAPACASTSIGGSTPVFAYKSATKLDSPEESHSLQHGVPLITDTLNEDTYLFGVTDTHIKKGEIGSVAVSGILRVKVTPDNVYDDSMWFSVQGSILGRVLQKEESFDENGKCEICTVQLMPWVTQLQPQTYKMPKNELDKNVVTIAQQLLAYFKEKKLTTIDQTNLVAALTKPVEDFETILLETVKSI